MTKYVMVSLDDKEAQSLSEVLGNKTCRKILDLLTNKEMTGSEIAEELKIPLNTAGYNLKKLVDSKLIETKSHFWSIKGKKIPVYTISNKSIVISPKSRLSLKIFLPVVAVVGLIAAGIKYITPISVAPVYDNAPQLMLKASENAAQASAVPSQISNSILSSILSTPWEVFLAGSLIAIGAYFIVKKIERRS